MNATGSRLQAKLENATFRLEPHGCKKGPIWIGEIIRLQSSAFPSKVPQGKPAERLNLLPGESLGHHAGFIYDERNKALGFEARPTAGGPSSFLNLVAAIAKHPPCAVFPVLTAQKVADLAKSKNGTLSLKIADPVNLQTVDPELVNVRDGLAFLTELMDGAYINTSIGVGPRRDGLDVSKLKKVVGWLAGERSADRGKVKKLQVTQPDEAGPILDFIGGQVKEQQTLQLLGDPKPDWKIKKTFLDAAYQTAKKYV